MKKIFSFLPLLCFQALFADVDLYNTEVVKVYTLNSSAVYNIPIGNVPTTIQFPGPLTSLEGSNISASDSNPAPVLLSYENERYFFAVRATQPNAQGALNVVHNDKTYVFNFYHNEQVKPYRTVNLVKTTSPGLSGENGALYNYSPLERPTTKTLIELIERSRVYQLVHNQHPGLLHDVEYYVPANLTTDYENFSVSIDEIFRYAEYDTIVFKLNLANTSEEDIFYQPQNIAVRVGENVYYPSIVDASGIIPAQAQSVSYLAITGKPNGQRANLSVKNQFQIIVSKITDPAKLYIP